MFRVGEFIKGSNLLFKYTNMDMEIGKVEDVWTHLNGKDYMDIRIIKHKNTDLHGELYPALNCGDYFELIR